MLRNKTGKVVMWGSFSKIAIAKGLAGYWPAGGEQWLLHHLLRFYFGFL